MPCVWDVIVWQHWGNQHSRDRILINAICVHRPWRLLSFLIFFFSFFSWRDGTVSQTRTVYAVASNHLSQFFWRFYSAWLLIRIRDLKRERERARRTLPVINYLFVFPWLIASEWCVVCAMVQFSIFYFWRNAHGSMLISLSLVRLSDSAYAPCMAFVSILISICFSRRL